MSKSQRKESFAIGMAHLPLEQAAVSGGSPTTTWGSRGNWALAGGAIQNGKTSAGGAGPDQEILGGSSYGGI